MELTETSCLTLSIDEAARVIGISRDTLRRMVYDGELPAFRAGRGKLRSKILIRRQAVVDFMAKREAAGVA